MNYSTLNLENDLLFFFTSALQRRYMAFCQILTSDWLNDVNQYAASYVTIQYVFLHK